LFCYLLFAAAVLVLPAKNGMLKLYNAKGNMSILFLQSTTPACKRQTGVKVKG
jgi:hypothetical protein